MTARIFRLLLDPTAGTEGGAAAAPAADNKDGQAAAKAPDLKTAADNLVAKHGDPTAALRVLLGENYGYRDQIRDARKQIPAEGSIVLAGDDAKAWGHYQALGKPADLKTALAEGGEAKAQVGTYRKAEVIARAADLTLLDGGKLRPGVLATLARELEIEFRDELGKDGKPALKDGKPALQAVVKGEGDKVTPLAEYAKAHWGEFLPSLRAEAARPALGTPNIARRPPPASAGSSTIDRPAAARRSVF